ncbi:AAA family ATPase [Arthrobacter sulfonylureivorans]|uniref:Nuclease SbcCD subunit C n=1 Tax=Arthrobacter sulfonylureivorans TaxID=2486855 RepID=A0ABY3WB54_9MICC|nr:SMC family ATPase [Arthrobacter sulfonylureivorans]UNK47241.1 SMC family ATPase [Arthrobacter sulfonylureivorans]
MRIHRLEIQAFGPFAARETIDFDELSSQGLFLLNGPTGAGKTSILDAICFALYGSVPGARQQGKRLRSDHAEPETEPEVVCEFSARGRRFEVTRNPQWERPSSRARSGSVTEQAHTLLREKVNGAWVQKSGRNDEAAAELLSVLGMSLEQFTKVVLLPQGDFAAFLRADAKERRPLLQRLFATDRYEAVEQTLADEAAKARSAYQAAVAGADQLVERATEEAARHLAAEDMPTQPLAAADLIAAFESSIASAAASVQHAATRGQEDLGRLRETIGRRELALADRAALAELEKLSVEHRQAADGHAALVDTLVAHRSAELLASPIRHRDQAALAMERAAKEFLDRIDAAETHPLYPAFVPSRPEPDHAGQAVLDEAAGRLAAELGRIRALLPEEQRLQSARSEVQRFERRAEQLALDLAAAAADREQHAATGRSLQEQLAALAETPDIGLLTERLEQAQHVREAVADHAACRAKTEAARARRDAAHTRQLACKEAWLSLLEQRLDQAAAELAATLAKGESCPVCGGIEHPQPAVAASGRLVTREQEAAARDEHAAAEALYTEAREACADLEQELSALVSRGGATDATEAAAAVATARASLDHAVAVRDRRRELQEHSAATTQQLEEIGQQLSALAVAKASADSELKAGRERTDELERKLHDALPDGGSLHDHAASLSRLDQLLADALRILAQHRHCGNALDQAEAELASAIDQSNFATEEEVRVSLLAPAQQQELERRHTAHIEAGQRLVVLESSEPVIRARTALENGVALPGAGELDEARDQADVLDRKVREHQVRHGVLAASQEQLAAYRRGFEEEQIRLAPIAARHELLQSVADTVRGLGENERKMTLTTYVLAARLEQIAAAASERLIAMTDGRYSLVHDDSKSGNKKSGLGLHVSDEWTGQRRDTATLSGGESFMASLALALGLADVVQAEAGGVDIETLFVDEGFGSLDEQALEQVMDALEGLRDGGRVIGLVSHVAEMKQRIGAQLQVTKGRHGSSVRTVLTGVA